MAVTDSDTRLECGREIDEVWAGIQHPPITHEQHCPHCRDARARMLPLARITSEQRDADQHDPDLQPAPELLSGVLGIARAEVRRGRRLPLDDLDHPAAIPTLTISEQTVAALARRAADGVAGVQVRRAQVTLRAAEPDTLPSAATHVRSDLPVPPASVRITMQVSVATGVAILSIATAVRRAVRTAVQTQSGLIPATIDIDVRDIHDA